MSNMKFLLPAIALLLLFQFAFAQRNIEVTETEQSMSKGLKHAFTTVIPKTKVKEAECEWKKYLKKKSKGSYKESNGEFVLSKTVVSEISTDSVLIYTLFSSLNDTDVNMTSLYTPDDSMFYASAENPVISANIKTFMRNFAVNRYRDAVADRLKKANKKLTTLEKEFSSLEKENSNYEKKIKKNERKIERLKDDVKSNQQLKELNNLAIFQQKKALATFITPSELKTSQEKNLKSLEKEKKKLDKKNESLHEDIEEYEEDNKEYLKKINTNISDNFPVKQAQIKAQKDEISGIELRLNNIQ